MTCVYLLQFPFPMLPHSTPKMQRVFISNLDQAVGRACARVFRAFGFEVYGTAQDDDESQPAPPDASRVIPRPGVDLAEFQRGVLSCSVVVYDLAFPDEAVAAMECCARAANQRKFICVSTFMTWARTELPERVEGEGDENSEDAAWRQIDPEELPDEREMEPAEVAKLYKRAKKPVPAWVREKLDEIRRQEEAERAAEAAEEAENGVENS